MEKIVFVLNLHYFIVLFSRRSVVTLEMKQFSVPLIEVKKLSKFSIKQT